jgi:hypothetical protein
MVPFNRRHAAIIEVLGRGLPSSSHRRHESTSR